MSKNVTSIYKDIINDRNLRESIPRFFELGLISTIPMQL